APMRLLYTVSLRDALPICFPYCCVVPCELWSARSPKRIGTTNHLGGTMSDSSTETANPVAASVPATPTAFMKTVLQEFSASFDTSITPLLEPLQTAATALAEAPEQLPGRKLAPKLRELHHQIDSLVRKVAAQQAYVLIFGPLKSGKSTFMNALSSSYVSEVTSLPAYPCMVYVRYSDEPGFEVSQYDGRTMKLKQREALDEILATGHQELMQR